MSAIHLTARGVRKTFGEGEAQTVALRGIDIDIDRGDFVAIMGPSGSGKSTLLYCLSGMDDVTDGSVAVHDGESESVEITDMDQGELAALRLTQMGFVFQQVHLLRNLTILDNVVLPGVTASPGERKAVVSRAIALLERTGIAELADREITEVSGGQLQRAAIARALINSPDLIFGDEPTGALNAATATEIMDLLVEVNGEGRTVVLVTHDANVAARARRVVVLRDGVVDGDIRRDGIASDDAWAESLAAWLTAHGT
ncbi:MAG: ABC transporter ATP-binding protein [Acidimicrobiia bacterium]|nr:ABC transporter ATP-binding protein [Acidimicrobiia bacterium]MDH5292917.1 ABC transporter ATP-binding protein [Acidimicrobiia bacterium]